MSDFLFKPRGLGNGRREYRNLKGQVFGMLTVIEYASKSRCGHILWRCLCECGGETIVSSSDLKSGHTKSCGCLGKGVRTNKRLLPKNKAELTYVYGDHCQGARKVQSKRGITGDQSKPLSCKEFQALIELPCYICGVEEAGGIDRVDSNLGYPGNSKPCCARCNYWKSSMSLSDFHAHRKRIEAHQAKIGQ